MKFGSITRMRGLVYFRLSPFEQSPFRGFFSRGFPNLMRFVRQEIFYVAFRKFNYIE